VGPRDDLESFVSVGMWAIGIVVAEDLIIGDTTVKRTREQLISHRSQFDLGRFFVTLDQNTGLQLSSTPDGLEVLQTITDLWDKRKFRDENIINVEKTRNAINLFRRYLEHSKAWTVRPRPIVSPSEEFHSDNSYLFVNDR